MKLLRQPNNWSCLLTSAAMVLDKPYEELIKVLGHDGSDILWPNLQEPYRRRAFIEPEIQFLFWHYDMVLVDYVPNVAYRSTASCIAKHLKFNIDQMLKDYDGILLGEFRLGVKHAVAWNHEEGIIYDPTSCTKQPLYAFNVSHFKAKMCRSS